MVTKHTRNGTAQAVADFDDLTVEYPEEDGEPSTDFQFVPLVYAVFALRARYADREDIYVGGNMLLYYRMNLPQFSVAPDVFMVADARGNHKRRSWFTWREDAAPAFVMEIASDSTWRHDGADKRATYAEIGVTEYWRFDPTGECFSPALIGERLVDGVYHPIEVAEDEGGILRGYSDVLMLEICVLPDLELRLYDPERGEWLLNYDEERAARQAAELQAQAAELQAQAAERDAQTERDARQAAEERVRQLEALLRAQDDDSA
ncbi:MAG: Uma2 family endonuclease [Chloroflexi bacterium]|nr:Uma2 family endonuclease [Chloroflexota bacterium]